MALSSTQKAQIAAWYKALQQQMIAEVAKTLTGEGGEAFSDRSAGWRWKNPFVSYPRYRYRPR